MNAYIDPSDNPDASSVLAPLGRHFDHLHSLVAARIFSHMARSMHSVDVSFSQINALFGLYSHGAQRIADLAAAAHLSHCAASRLVSRLEQEGLVRKQYNPANRRERWIHLTPAGIAYLRKLQQETANAYADALQDVPPALAKQLLEVLDGIVPFLPPHELSA